MPGQPDLDAPRPVRVAAEVPVQLVQAPLEDLEKSGQASRRLSSRHQASKRCETSFIDGSDFRMCCEGGPFVGGL